MELDFAAWCTAASVRERVGAVEPLSDALFDESAGEGERVQCEAMLMRLAADPSPKVRATLAQRLAGERKAPRRIVRLLCDDADAVAVPLLEATRVLGEDDLIDIAAVGSPRLRCALARRERVGTRVSAALATLGERVVCIELLGNPGAEIATSTLRLLVRSHGSDGTVRELLLRRRDLPADIRQTLLLEAGQSLAGMDLARQVLGDTAARRIASEACEAATSIIAEDLDAGQTAAFVKHLRETGQITTAFLLRAACGGHIDLFAASLAGLTGLRFTRVRSILVEARDPAFSALCAAAGLPRPVVSLLLSAVRAWKEIAHRGTDAGEGTAARVLDRLSRDLAADGVNASDELRAMLARLAGQAARRGPERSRLESIAA